MIDGADNSALAAAVDQVAALAERRHFESAARLRDRTATAVETLQRLRALASLPELVAAAPDGQGGYQLAVVRYGRLAAAGNARRGVPPMPVVDAITAAAQAIWPEPGPLGGALVEETALIARWLEAPGVRIVRVKGTPDAAGWPAGKRAGPAGVRAADRTAPNARAAVRPRRSRWRRWRGPARPPRPATIRRGWITRRAPRSRRRR